jgi:hypothetical protein
MKKLFPEPQGPNSPIESGGSTAVEAITAASVRASRSTPSRSSPEAESER